MKARKKGIINVPDVISAGHAITPTENGNDEYKILYEVADGAAAGDMRLSFSNITDENVRKGLEIIQHEIDGKK